MNDFTMTNILLANFQPSTEADKLSEELRKYLGLSTRYKVARLAMGRSLGEDSYPQQAADSQGRPIKGDLLFGVDEHALWIGLLVANVTKYNPKQDINLATLQNAVKRHWSRGVKLIMDDWNESEEDYQNFVELLITRRAILPDTVDSNFADFDPEIKHFFNEEAKPVYIEIGQEVDTNVPFKHLVNGVGYSPHIAIMGQAGSGKTRIMLETIKQIQEQAKCPIILLDLGKGDLANDTSFIESIGANVIQVPDQPIPLDMFYGSNESEESASDMVLGFRDSFSHVMQSKPGAKQLDNIRVSLKPLFANNKKITLENIRDHIDHYYSDHNVSRDIVISTINDLNERLIFRPDLSPSKFFTQSWVITFAYARDTIKNLSASLLLDSLNNFMKRIDESPKDNSGNRAIRVVLAIDEARHLLDSKHKALSENIRLHRSKGLVVMMASQSPDDYEGSADDYLENIGLPICFKTNATSNQVLQNMFKGKPNFSSLASGVCLTLKENKAVKVKAFSS